MKPLPFAIYFFFGLLMAGCTDYDVDTPDTPANRSGFIKHFGFEPAGGVTEIYYYADEFGADVRFQLAFKCPDEVAEQIIEKLSLLPSPDDDSGLDPRSDLLWWKPDSTNGRSMWCKQTNDGQYHRVFWYSKEDGRAYYHEYSM